MSNAIQLSKLPFPDVIEIVDFETEYADLANEFAALWPPFDRSLESCLPAKVMQAFVYKVVNLKQRVNDAAREVMLPYARKGNLDNLGAFFGVTRLMIVPADPDHGRPDPVMEEDDDFRERIALAPSSFSVAGPEAAYVFHARSASGDVLDASAVSPEPDDIKAIVYELLSKHGASAKLTADMQAALDAAAWPGEVFVSVLSRLGSGEVDADIWSFTGPDSTVSMDEATKNLDHYLASSRRMGRDITMSGLYAALQVAGIQNVVINQPEATVVVGPTQAAHCTKITLRYRGVGE